MEKDLFAKLQLPKLDLKRIQNTDTQNSTSFPYFKKENHECLEKNKTMSPTLKGVVESAVPSFTEVRHFSSIPRKKIKIIRRKFSFKSSGTSSSNSLENDLENMHPLMTKESSIVATNLVRDSYDNSGKKKCFEINSVSLKCFRDPKTLPKKINCKVTLPMTELNCHTEKRDVGSSSCENKNEIKILLDKTAYKRSVPENLSGNSMISILKQKPSHCSSTKNAIESVAVKDVTEQLETYNETESEPAVCIISEVFGNAVSEFSGMCETQENLKEASGTQLITPKKTNDITKIKGWRRKQFFVEKPTTVEFYSIANENMGLEKKIELTESEVIDPNAKDTGNVENAFVCETLDEFLDRESDLKIAYDIPHLYAEFGIKLTSDEVVSKPILSDKDFKEIETRYCMSVPLPVCDVTNLSEVEEESIKRVKRPIEDDLKATKMLKLEINKKQSVKFPQKPADKLMIESEDSIHDFQSKETDFKAVCSSNKNFNNFKLVNKLIALVVYPGPFMPLNPIVQYHLNKIRSYHTIVDKNWANFAASAFLVKGERYKRSVLPAYCCVKIETNSSVNCEKDDIVNKNIDSESVISKDKDETEGDISKKQRIKLKKCSVVIEKLKSVSNRDPWCLEHNCYNCAECGLNKSKFNEFNPEKLRKQIKCAKDESGETVIVSPRASFDKKIASLLAKKVRLLKFNGDTLTSIDCLKTLTPNTVEFIKLKFVKESFLTGYISIWYLKPENPTIRSRAFLTFSQTPPVPNAVNLKSNAFSLKNLPKVITEIVSAENTFYSNEYAILHCDGEIWEIHGSLNIAFGKCDKNVEQIFTSAELPELKKLEEIAYNILHVKAVKWWVVDLTQKFRLIELKSGNFSTVVTRKKFIETIALNSFGFLPLKQDSENRVLGAYIVQRLLPFVLIGPYYLLETHDLILKSESSTAPFMYYGEENVTSNYPLKLFINSVIKNLEKNDKKLEGLWLYDKMCLDSTSYLEVVTTNLGDPMPNKYACIDIEHGYSLSSLTNSSLSGATSGLVKRKDGKEEFKNVTVYLYFDIFELGFVKGELQFDNSVIISHPLDQRTRMKSHKIGDWFIGIIKRRIQFFPKDLSVKWLITKHKEDLRERRPFNKFFLGGAHILTRYGIHYLLEMSESKIEKLGLDKNEIAKAMAESKVLKELTGLKTLAELLPTNSNKTLTMAEVLSAAVNEIKKLKALEEALEIKKLVAEKEKLNLTHILLKKINFSPVSFLIKLKMLRNIERMFTKTTRDFNEDLVRKFNMFRVGRNYLRFKKKFYEDLYRKRSEKICKEELQEKLKKINKSKTTKSKSKKLSFILHSYPKTCIPEGSSLINFSNGAIRNKEDSHNHSELHLQTEKLNSISNKFISAKSVCRTVLGKSYLEKTKLENEKKNEEIKNAECSAQSGANSFNDGFLKLTSSEIPKNIKLTWENWSSENLYDQKPICR